jgi:hypothetical protein
MTNVEDHHVVFLDGVVNTIRISGGRQDTNLRIGGCDTNERIAE